MEEVKSIPKMMEDIASDMCDHYCKWPDAYVTDNEELDDLMTEKLIAEHCDKCPMNILFI